MTHLSYPRQHARTQRFTLGVPRGFAVAPDGTRIAFARSRSGTDRSQALWVLDVALGRERVAADPQALLGGSGEQLPAKERARRERSREGSAGIVRFAVDDAVRAAAFALSGRLFTAALDAPAAGDGARELSVPGPVVDPRPSPDGRWIAYVADGALRVVGADGSGDRAVAEPDGAEVTWGLAEFVAAEEMGRDRGFWWSPDSAALLVARVDEAPVRRRWIAEPAHPDRAPAQVAYPAAGTPNAEVRLALFGLADGLRHEVQWDRARYPYLAAVHWSRGGSPVLLVQARDQREQRYLTLDPATGATRTLAVENDRIWLDLFPGTPVLTPDGALVRIVDEFGARVLKVGETTLTGAELHLRGVLDAGGPGTLVAASAGAAAVDPEIGQIHVYRVDAAGAVRISDRPGVHTAVRGGGLTVLTSAVPDRPGSVTRVLRDSADGGPGGNTAGGPGGNTAGGSGTGNGSGTGAGPADGAGGSGTGAGTAAGTTAGTAAAVVVAEIASLAETPVLTARPRLLEAGERRIPTAVLLPSGYQDADGPLPVLLDPYGGPHGQRVVAAHNAYLVPQWFADQGFAVIVADGRGTPGRCPRWEKSIAGDFAGVSVADQVEALTALAGRYPLDLDRVGIRGWSYGGYLAALAVLRRPDVFHAAVVGAPVTDLRMYDTHYTERYLGHPDERPEVYEANSVVTSQGIRDLAEPARPMMIIHGLADDNVTVAHSLRLSSALLAAGRPHQVLPLSGVTHMAPQEQVAENLLLLQADFLRRSLGVN